MGRTWQGIGEPATSQRRQCFVVLEGQRDDAGYIPSLVTENEPGHAPLSGRGPFASPWHWGTTYDEAKAICARQNASTFHLTEQEVTEIVTSSMARRARARS